MQQPVEMIPKKGTLWLRKDIPVNRALTRDAQETSHDFKNQFSVATFLYFMRRNEFSFQDVNHFSLLFSMASRESTKCSSSKVGISTISYTKISVGYSKRLYKTYYLTCTYVKLVRITTEIP